MRYAALALIGVLLFSSIALAQEPQKDTPVVEVVFVLDTTGSMSGLIEGAKQKIWSIVNHIAEGKPTPDVKVGLVGYRDKGDAYITKVVDLSDDLDEIFEKLMAFRAQGGGDTPESVNQALNEAVTKIAWSTDNKTLRVIFLVGDCPPHMDYTDDVKYKDSCKAAVKKDIIINTVQCGNHRATTPIWQEIARLGEGTFVQIAQSGGVVAVETPYDKELAKLARELDKTVVHFGKAEQRKRAEKKMDEAEKLAGAASKPAAADRAAFKGKKGPAAPGGKDLVEEANKGGLDLGKVKKEELPEEIQKMSKEEREKYVEDKRKKREEIQKKIAEISKKRKAYMDKELKKRTGAKDGFDKKVIDAVKKHAAKKGITYEEEKEEKEEKKAPEKKEEAPKKEK